MLFVLSFPLRTHLLGGLGEKGGETLKSRRVKVKDIKVFPGCPQGCVLSPFLFVLYTNDCQSCLNGHHIIKFADDSSSDNSEHGPVVDDFMDWCESFLKHSCGKLKRRAVTLEEEKAHCHPHCGYISPFITTGTLFIRFHQNYPRKKLSLDP